jgi:hypothetical protein
MDRIHIGSVEQGRSLFRAHKAKLAAKGIHLGYAMDRYLTQREIETGRLAMDAVNPPIAAMAGLPGPLSTDPNAALPWMLTSSVNPEIIRALFSPLSFGKILGERAIGTWTDQTHFLPMTEIDGEVSTYDDFVNNGRAGININYPQVQSYLCQTMLNYGELQIARAGLAKIQMVSEIGMAAADLLNRFQNLSYAFGIANLQNYGIMNSPYISAALTPATKAWGGTGWFNGGAPAATANEVYNDVVALITQLVSQTNGAIEITDPMTLALSPNSQIGLTFANSFGVFVKELLKEGYPNLKVKTAPQYGQQTATNPQGFSAAGNMMQLIPDSLQGQTVAYCGYNEKLRAHKIIPSHSSWSQKQTSGTWGTIIRLPVGIVTMIGI